MFMAFPRSAVYVLIYFLLLLLRSSLAPFLEKNNTLPNTEVQVPVCGNKMAGIDWKSAFGMIMQRQRRTDIHKEISFLPVILQSHE